MLLIWLIMPALAQSSVRIVEGTPEFESCLGSERCVDRFYRFLGESMTEQGFSMASAPQLGDAALRLQERWQVGAMLTTFPFEEARCSFEAPPALPSGFSSYLRSISAISRAATENSLPVILR